MNPYRHQKWWTDEEIDYAATNRTWITLDKIASNLGRTTKAVDAKLRAINQYPTRQALVTSGEAARLTGYSQQWLTELARLGRIKGHRMPCNNLRYHKRKRWWWLFEAERLPRKKCASV